MLPRARLREILALTAWVAGAIPAPPRRRLLVEDDHDLFIASHDLFNNLPVSLMVRWCYGSCCCPLPPAPSIDGICLLLHLMVYCSFDCWTSVTGGSTSARTSGAPPTSRSTSRTKTTTLGRSSSGRRTTSPACSTACPSPSPTRTSPRW